MHLDYMALASFKRILKCVGFQKNFLLLHRASSLPGINEEELSGKAFSCLGLENVLCQMEMLRPLPRLLTKLSAT